MPLGMGYASFFLSVQFSFTLNYLSLTIFKNYFRNEKQNKTKKLNFYLVSLKLVAINIKTTLK